MSYVQIHICVSCIRSPLNASIYGINRHLGPIQCKTQRKRKKERKKTRKHPFDQESDQEKRRRKKENTPSTKKRSSVFSLLFLFYKFSPQLFNR